MILQAITKRFLNTLSTAIGQLIHSFTKIEGTVRDRAQPLFTTINKEEQYKGNVFKHAISLLNVSSNGKTNK